MLYWIAVEVVAILGWTRRCHILKGATIGVNTEELFKLDVEFSHVNICCSAETEDARPAEL